MDVNYFFYVHFGSRQPQSSIFVFIYFVTIIIWKNVARILKIFSLLKVHLQINGAKHKIELSILDLVSGDQF